MDEELTRATMEEWAEKHLEEAALQVEVKSKPSRKRRKVRGIFKKPGKDPTAWWIRWWCNYGHRHEERIGPKALAEQEVEKRRVGVKTEDFCLTRDREAKRKSKPALFQDVKTRYLAWAKDHKPRSLKFRRSALNHLEAAFGSEPLSKIDRPSLESYQASRWAASASDSTVNKELSVLSHLFKKSIEWNLATANPVTGIERRPEPQGRTRWLTSEEESRLVGALPEKYRPVTRLAIHTGLRLGELRALSWKDVNLGPKPFLIVLRGKSQKTEDIPLNREAVAVLEALNQKSEHQDGKVFNLPSHFSEFFAGYAGDAGLHDVTFHTMRHTFCSRLVQAGVPIRVVQVLARHSRVEVTERYAHVGDSYAREAVGRLTERGTEARNTFEKVTQGVTDNYQLPQVAGIASGNELAEARGSRTHPRGD